MVSKSPKSGVKAARPHKVAPLRGPPAPEEYLKLHIALGKGAPPAGFYSQYLEDYQKYLDKDRVVKYHAHVDGMYRKAVKKEFSEEITLEYARTLKSLVGTHPTAAHVAELGGVPGASDSATAKLMRFKPRVKQAPPEPVPAIVAAKSALKRKKRDAKVKALTAQAVQIGATSDVKAADATAKRTYASVLATSSRLNAESAAKVVAETRQARVYLRKEKVETKRVATMFKGGVQTKLPDKPQGTFLAATEKTKRSTKAIIKSPMGDKNIVTRSVSWS